MDKTKKELLDINEYATGEPLSCLVIDNDRVKNKFRKNFSELINFTCKNDPILKSKKMPRHLIVTPSLFFI